MARVNDPFRPATRRVALYCRVSSDEQRQDETIDVQRDYLHRYCELQGYEIVAEYLDDGVKGTLPFAKRPHGRRLLEDARSGRFDTVLFMRVSRFARRLLVALDTYQQLDGVGVAIKSASEAIDTGEPVGRLLFQMLGAFAEFDRETIIDNTTRGRARGAKKGRWYGVVPMGYTVVDGLLSPNAAEMLPGVSEADVVREVFERIAGGSSATRETARLAALGVTPFVRYVSHQGRESVRLVENAWVTSRLTKMIRNPLYRGEHVYKGRFENVTRAVPALVTPEVWQRAGAQLGANKRLSKRNTKHEYLLAGLIRCGVCGHGYMGASAAKGGPSHYMCSYMSRVEGVADGPSRRRCRGKVVKAAWLEAAVWADIDYRLRHSEDIIGEARRQMAERRRDASAAAEQRRTFTAALAAKDDERQTVITMARRRKISPEEADRELDAIAREQRAIQAELDMLANREAVARIVADQADAIEQDLADVRAELDGPLTFERKRTIVTRFVNRIEIAIEGEARRKKAHIRLHYRFSAPREIVEETAGVRVGETLRA
jgi:site-specific DNA recombinase